MSLVNAMLRDLDERHIDGALETKEPFIQPTICERPARSKSYLMSTAVVVLVGYALVDSNLLHFLLKDISNNRRSIDTVNSLNKKYTHLVNTENPSKEDSTITIDMPSLKESQNKGGAEGPGAHDTKPYSTALAQQDKAKVSLLLEEASKALLDNRLTVPVSNNSFYYFQHVLRISPENEKALAGITEIHRRYQRLFELALKRKHWVTANSYIVRLHSTGVSNTAIDAMKMELSKSKSQHQLLLAAKKNSGMNFSALDASIKLPKRALEIALSPVQRNSITLSKSYSAQSVKQAEVFRKIDIAISTGNLAEAESLLRFDTLLPEGRYNYLRAKWLVANEHQQQAIDLLQNRTESGEFSQTYYRYLAALYQQVGHYDLAIKVYQSLLGMNRNSVDAWLGLAISYDANGVSYDALEAYRSAKALGHSDPAVQRFISQRISALSG